MEIFDEITEIKNEFFEYLNSIKSTTKIITINKPMKALETLTDNELNTAIDELHLSKTPLTTYEWITLIELATENGRRINLQTKKVY
jgi:hypothetical protein